MSRLKRKLKKQANTINHLEFLNHCLKSQLKTMQDEDNLYTKVKADQFAIMYTDSQELKYIDKMMRQHDPDKHSLYHQVAREANDLHGLHAPKVPLIERKGVRKMLKRGFNV